MIGPNILQSGPYTAADDDGIAQNQTPGAAGNLTLNGAFVSGGVATLDLQRRVIITAASDETAKTFTLYGTNSNGIEMQETLTGPGAGLVVVSLRNYKTVTRVAVSAATTGNVKVGTNTIASTAWLPLNQYWTPFNVGIGCVVSGTVNYTVEYTDANLFDLDIVKFGPIPVFPHAVLVSKTANASDNFLFPTGFMRTTLNSWTGSGSVTTYVRQQRNG